MTRVEMFTLALFGGMAAVVIAAALALIAASILLPGALVLE